MIHHFSIVPSVGVDHALARILDRAHEDPWILHLNPAPVHYLVFCVSLDHVQDVRKRYKDVSGEWHSYYSFRGSELYAVGHAVSQANARILETRAANDCPF